MRHLGALAVLVFFSSLAVAAESFSNGLFTPAQKIIDNDGVSKGLEVPSFNFGPSANSQPSIPRLFIPFEEVASYISPYIENSFDAFIFVNSATTGGPQDLIPYQHMQIIRREVAGAPLFERDTQGNVIGFHKMAQTLGVYGVSTGNGSGGILTFSGVFRIDKGDSKAKLNTYKEAPMSWQLYIDFVYGNGQDSGVAIHGTPTVNHKYLGKQRASHGCVRTFPENARYLHTLLMSPEFYSQDIPEFDVRSPLPKENLRNGQVKLRPGIKALIVVFNGYKKAA